MEDLTDREEIRQNPKCDRKVCLYGYVRGTHFMNKSSIHIPGEFHSRSLDLGENIRYRAQQSPEGAGRLAGLPEPKIR